MKQINTKNGIYEYKEVEFILGTKKINREISRDNLLAVKQLFDKHDLEFGLLYGTLLGAIREHNFIAHDEDTDIFILYENKEQLFDLLFELRDLGFEVGRENEALLSILKDGEYIDIYFYKKTGTKNRACEGYVLESDILENMEEYEFLGEIFKVPKNPIELLVKLYGKDWKIPDENGKPQNYGLYLKIRNYIKNNFKNIFFIISWIKRKLNV